MKPNQHLDRLANLDTGAISDALDALGMSGRVAPLYPLFPTRRIAGRAITVKLVPHGDSPPEHHLGAKAVDCGSGGIVIVVANAGRLDVAGWGGNLALGAKLRGVDAVVLDGATRDAEEIGDLALPFFAKGCTPVTARGRIVEASTNQPIEVCGIHVEPGDYVMGDMSGVVFMPAAHVEAVISAAERIVGAEAAIAARIRAGEKLQEVMGKRYEGMLSTPPANEPHRKRDAKSPVSR